MNIQEQIKLIVKQLEPKLIAIRHHLHAHPELSFEEHETSKYVYNELQSIGITQVNFLSKTGVVAIIEGKNAQSKTVALRADLDALPITELNNVSYKSKNAGVMHACGHDVHTTCLLGAAKVLHEMRHSFEGTVKLIFQPGEEKLPGGASLMIKDGVLLEPKVNSIFGQHVMPLIPVGKVGFKKGMYMASSDELYLTVKGKGGHGALPHLLNDPITAAAQIIIALQQLVSRRANPIIPTVLSFGKIQANGATNVIPDEVHIEGTFRTLNEEWRNTAHELMLQMAKDTARAFGTEVIFEIKKGYPFLKNNEALTTKAIKHAQEYLGEENVVSLDTWMAAEDFAYYSQQTDACFYRLGTRNDEKQITSAVHTPTFNIDESALIIGAGLMAYLAIKELEATA